MSEYTPDTQEVRDFYEEGKCQDRGVGTTIFGPQFDRWLAETIAEAYLTGYKRAIKDITEGN